MMMMLLTKVVPGTHMRRTIARIQVYLTKYQKVYLQHVTIISVFFTTHVSVNHVAIIMEICMSYT